MGVFTPYFRGHSSDSSKRREPWLYSEETFSLIKQCIIIRYQFLPFWDYLFFDNSQSGMPIMRALWINFPKCIEVFDEDEVFMLGDSILVQPQLEKGLKFYKKKNYIPETWFHFQTFEKVDLKTRRIVQNQANALIRHGKILVLYNPKKIEE